MEAPAYDAANPLLVNDDLLESIPLQPAPDRLTVLLQETAVAQAEVGATAQALNRRNKKLRTRVATLVERKKSLAAKCRERRVRSAAGLVH